MCKLEYLSHILRKRSTQIYAIWVNLNINQIIWGLNYIAFRVVFQEIYAADKKINATAVALVAPNINSDNISHKISHNIFHNIS